MIFAFAIVWTACYNVNGEIRTKAVFHPLLLWRDDDALQTDKGRRDVDGYILGFNRAMHTARRSGEPVSSGVQRQKEIAAILTI